MTELSIALVGPNGSTWFDSINQVLKELGFKKIDQFSKVQDLRGQPGPYSIVFVDEKSITEKDVAEKRSWAHAVFLVAPEGAGIPSLLSEGKVDDVLLYPIRNVEVLGKLKQLEQILMWEKMGALNDSLSGLVDRLKEDVELAERLQKAKMPDGYKDFKGVNIQHRYLAGFKSGADHFDLVESRDKQQLGVVLTDSSSYGLSSSLLAIMMKVAVKLSVQESRSSAETVQQIRDELMLTMRAKDTLSIFYGLISRKDLSLNFIHLGESRVFHQTAGKEWKVVSAHGKAIDRDTLQIPEGSQLTLQPGDRLLVASGGAFDCLGAPAFDQLIQATAELDGKALMNEWAMELKKRVSDEEDYLPEDSTVALLTVDQNVIRMQSK